MRVGIAVVGGGIVGAAIARELSRYTNDLLLLDQHPDLGMGTTKANSAIVHAGFAAEPGTLKAKLNVRGNELYRELQPVLGLELDFIGSLVVATDEAGLLALQELQKQGEQNGVAGLEIWSRAKLLSREPNLSQDVTGALYAPTGGIMNPFQATLALAENAVRNGAQVLTECKVEGVVIEQGKVVGLNTSRGYIAASVVINAAGIEAGEISQSAGDYSVSIKPRKGEYILFDTAIAGLVNSVIFPLPTKITKGIVISPTIHGNTFIGPNAAQALGKEDLATTASGLAEVVSGAALLLPKLPLAMAITQFAGLRAVAEGDDFIVRESVVARGLFHAAGIQSPGLTAAPAIAEMLVKVMREAGIKLVERVDFRPANPVSRPFHALSESEKQERIAARPDYGRIICRCETVTEGEIVDAIHGVCGARTLDGVKRRVRTGSGRCQGGFCGPRVTAILSRELKIPVTEVRKDSLSSYMFYDKIRRNEVE